MLAKQLLGIDVNAITAAKANFFVRLESILVAYRTKYVGTLGQAINWQYLFADIRGVGRSFAQKLFTFYLVVGVYPLFCNAGEKPDACPPMAAVAQLVTDCRLNSLYVQASALCLANIDQKLHRYQSKINSDLRSIDGMALTQKSGLDRNAANLNEWKSGMDELLASANNARSQMILYSNSFTWPGSVSSSKVVKLGLKSFLSGFSCFKNNQAALGSNIEILDSNITELKKFAAAAGILKERQGNASVQLESEGIHVASFASDPAVSGSNGNSTISGNIRPDSTLKENGFKINESGKAGAGAESSPFAGLERVPAAVVAPAAAISKREKNPAGVPAIAGVTGDLNVHVSGLVSLDSEAPVMGIAYDEQDGRDSLQAMLGKKPANTGIKVAGAQAHERARDASAVEQPAHELNTLFFLVHRKINEQLSKGALKY